VQAVPDEEIMGTVSQPDLQPKIKRHYRSVEERRHIVEETLVRSCRCCAKALTGAVRREPQNH
jgi:hypothetical protein